MEKKPAIGLFQVATNPSNSEDDIGPNDDSLPMQEKITIASASGNSFSFISFYCSQMTDIEPQENKIMVKEKKFLLKRAKEYKIKDSEVEALYRYHLNKRFYEVTYNDEIENRLLEMYKKMKLSNTGRLVKKVIVIKPEE